MEVSKPDSAPAPKISSSSPLPIPNSSSSRFCDAGIVSRISSNTELRELTGDSIKLGWAKTSKVSRAPAISTLAGHSSAVIRSATGLSNLTSSERIAAAVLRSIVSILTWICMNLRRPGEVTISPDCW